MPEVEVLTIEQWNHLIEDIPENVPIVVKFGAEWCGPCKALAPRFHSLSERFAGKAAFLVVDIDELSQIAEKFEITSLPTILVFLNQKIVRKTIGAGASVIEEIENSLAGVMMMENLIHT